MRSATHNDRVILADEQSEFGGALQFETEASIAGLNGYQWAQKALAELNAMDNVRVLPRTTV
ncbi:MAG: hypothetical protein AAFO77_10845, partial [Pseudomonadota bacterium]